MNIKKFFKTFITFTLALSAILALILFGKFFYQDIGSGEKIASLDEYERGARRNILVMGTDKSGLRSDVIMIFSFSEKENDINSVSVPRDTRMNYGNGYQKINVALALGGDELAVEKIKEVTKIPIHEYVKVNFQAVSDLVDAVGGVEYEVPQNMRYNDPYQDLVINLDKGMQTLDGDKALQLLRFRKYPMGDLQRIEVQQDFIKEAFKQKMKVKYITKIGKIYSAVEDNISTSLSLSDVTKLAKTVKAKGVDAINSHELPTYLSPSGTYVRIDESKIDNFVEEYFK